LYQYNYQKFRLSAACNPIVKYGWIMSGSGTMDQTVPDLLIPDGFPEIIFVLKGGYTKNLIDQPNSPILIKKSCVIGLQTSSVLASKIIGTRLIGLKLRPLGLHLLTDGNVSGTLNNNLDFEHFNLNWLQDIELKLKKLDDISQITSLLSLAISEQIKAVKHTTPESLTTKNIIQDITLNKGLIKVGELAERHFKSIRQIQRYFKSYLDTTPKVYIQIIRFKNFYKQTVLDLAPTDYLDHGYFDQNHFIKDFKAKLGITPKYTEHPEFQRLNEIARQSKS